jgi:hypothetical protein
MASRRRDDQKVAPIWLSDMRKTALTAQAIREDDYAATEITVRVLDVSPAHIQPQSGSLSGWDSDWNSVRAAG